MGMRPHPRMARTDTQWPEAWGTCDRCSLIGNLVDFRWDIQFAGPSLINKRFLVCEYCLDEPQEQLRTIILPPDPPPLYNARPEPYVMDETDWLTTGIRSDNPANPLLETQDGELLVTQPSATEAETEDPG